MGGPHRFLATVATGTYGFGYRFWLHRSTLILALLIVSALKPVDGGLVFVDGTDSFAHDPFPRRIAPPQLF